MAEPRKAIPSIPKAGENGTVFYYSTTSHRVIRKKVDKWLVQTDPVAGHQQAIQLSYTTERTPEDGRDVPIIFPAAGHPPFCIIVDGDIPYEFPPLPEGGKQVWKHLVKQTEIIAELGNVSYDWRVNFQTAWPGDSAPE